MLGTIVNVGTIILGSIIGVLLNKGIKDSYKNTIMTGIGISVIVIGMAGGMESNNTILVILSVVLGSLIGEALAIQTKLDNLGDKLQGRLGGAESTFSKGFVTATLIFCIGAMAIVGALESGLSGNHTTLFAKSIIDGITAIILASTLGIGVAFSAIPVFLYQGSITLLANYLKDILSQQLVTEMSAVGGILIIAIGINILELKNIKVGNMIPAIFIPIIYFIGVGLLG